MQESQEGKARSRRNFDDEQKAAIVRRHLADKVPVSDLADEYDIQPSLIYLWIKQVLEQAERAFQQPAGGKRRRAVADAKDRKIPQLEARVSAAGSWSAGMAASRASAFACVAPRTSRERDGWWPATSSTTTRSVCTAPSATSRRPTSSPIWKRGSSPSGIASSMKLARDAPPSGDGSLPDGQSCPTTAPDLAGGQGSAEEQPERRCQGQDRSRGGTSFALRDTLPLRSP